MAGHVWELTHHKLHIPATKRNSGRIDPETRPRIASPEMLPSVGLLPHVICSPPGFGGGEHEADQHGDTG